jgi:hypothetical protein
MSGYEQLKRDQFLVGAVTFLFVKACIQTGGQTQFVSEYRNFLPFMKSEG